MECEKTSLTFEDVLYETDKIPLTEEAMTEARWAIFDEKVRVLELLEEDIDQLAGDIEIKLEKIEKMKRKLQKKKDLLSDKEEDVRIAEERLIARMALLKKERLNGIS